MQGDQQYEQLKQKINDMYKYIYNKPFIGSDVDSGYMSAVVELRKFIKELEASGV